MVISLNKEFNVLLFRKRFDYASKDLYSTTLYCADGQKIRIYIDTGNKEINIYTKDNLLNRKCYEEYTKSLKMELERFGVVKIH